MSGSRPAPQGAATWNAVSVDPSGMVQDTKRSNGMHALRHHYASVLLDGGVSIRAVADYLGHADPGFTLRTYAHLVPNSETVRGPLWTPQRLLPRDLCGMRSDQGPGMKPQVRGPFPAPCN